MASAAIYEQCSSCGVPSFPLIVVSPKKPTKHSRDISLCGTCHAKQEAVDAQNRKDEERERAEAAERSKRAAERDQQRNEKRRAS